MHEQIRQDVIVDLRDLSSEERKRFLDRQLAILAEREQESRVDHEASLYRCELIKENVRKAKAEANWAEYGLQKDKEQQVIFQRQQELQILQSKEFLRPSHVHYPTVGYDEELKKFTVTSDTLVAYGDTPEMACDNFDHLWVYGND